MATADHHHRGESTARAAPADHTTSQNEPSSPDSGKGPSVGKGGRTSRMSSFSNSKDRPGSTKAERFKRNQNKAHERTDELVKIQEKVCVCVCVRV